jgi:hypothetical protein
VQSATQLSQVTQFGLHCSPHFKLFFKAVISVIMQGMNTFSPKMTLVRHLVTRFGLNRVRRHRGWLAVTLSQEGLYRAFDFLIMCLGAAGHTHTYCTCLMGVLWHSTLLEGHKRVELLHAVLKTTALSPERIPCLGFVYWRLKLFYLYGNQSRNQAKRCSDKPGCVIIEA